MKLLGSTETKITKNENGENVPYLEITEVVLIHCDIVNSSYQQDLRAFDPKKFVQHLLLINRLVNY